MGLNGTATFAGGTLVISINGSEILEQLKSGSNISILLFSFTQLGGEFDDVVLHDTGATTSDCDRVVASPAYTQGTMNVILRIDSSGCNPGVVSSLSAGGIAAIVIVAVAITGAIVAMTLVPGIREKVRPYFRPKTKDGLDNENRAFSDTDTGELLAMQESPNSNGSKSSGWVPVNKTNLK